MTPRQRRATTWLAPLPLAALPFVTVFDNGEVPNWLKVVATAPGLPFFTAMFGPGDGDSLLVAGMVTSSTVWYSLGVALAAFALGRLAKQPRPSRMETATALFLFVVGAIVVTSVLLMP